MVISTLASELFEHIGKTNSNDLNSVLQIDRKRDDQTETFDPSYYYDIDSFIDVCKLDDQTFSSLSLNIESLNAKFNQLSAFISMLDRQTCKIDAYLIQETWLSENQCKSSIIDHYHMPRGTS